MRARQRSLEEPYYGRAVPPASPRYLSWLFAAPEARDPLLGVYALMAEWRGLMDPAAEASAARLKVAWWQEEIGRLTRGAPVPSAREPSAPVDRSAGAAASYKL